MKKTVWPILLLAAGVAGCTRDPPDRPRSPPAPPPPAALAELELARQKNCMGCHAVDRKIVGPAYAEVAARYAGQPGAVDALAAKVRRGGVGAWGPVPMPANTQVTPAEATRLVQWILTPTPTPAAPR